MYTLTSALNLGDSIIYTLYVGAKWRLSKKEMRHRRGNKTDTVELWVLDTSSFTAAEHLLYETTT